MSIRRPDNRGEPRIINRTFSSKLQGKPAHQNGDIEKDKKKQENELTLINQSSTHKQELDKHTPLDICGLLSPILWIFSRANGQNFQYNL